MYKIKKWDETDNKTNEVEKKKTKYNKLNLRLILSLRA